MARPKSLNNRAEGRSSHRPEGLGEEKQRPLVDSGPALRPERLLRSPAVSGRSLRPEVLAKHYLRFRPHVSNRGMQRPYSLLFSDWRNQSRLGPTDLGRPPGKDQGTNGESKAERTSQTSIPGTILCTPAETVLCNLPSATVTQTVL